LFCLCLLLPIGAYAQNAGPKLFVFGDSLSDTGNLASFSPNKFCHPADFPIGDDCNGLFYQQNRVSNGPVAVEILSANLGSGEPEAALAVAGGTNYAVAGATARVDEALPEFPLGNSLATQLGLFAGLQMSVDLPQRDRQNLRQPRRKY
jgi:phospholipase/lecithinase/hemolysin